MINNKILGLIGLCAKAGKITSGTEACMECINKHKAKLVIISVDCSDKTKENFKYLCSKQNVPILEYETTNQLSNAIGKQNKAVICIKSKDISKEIERILSGGGTIG